MTVGEFQKLAEDIKENENFDKIRKEIFNEFGDDILLKMLATVYQYYYPIPITDNASFKLFSEHRLKF